MKKTASILTGSLSFPSCSIENASTKVKRLVSIQFLEQIRIEIQQESSHTPAIGANTTKCLT